MLFDIGLPFDLYSNQIWQLTKPGTGSFVSELITKHIHTHTQGLWQNERLEIAYLLSKASALLSARLVCIFALLDS